MADNTQKNIEDVVVGDRVLGFDGKKHIAETVLQVEAPVRDHLYQLSFSNGSTLSLTREHPLYTAQGWKSISPQSTAAENPTLHVATLKIGDSVLNSSGAYVQVTAMTYIPGKVQTYNLKKVTNANDFFANSFLAHNKGGGGGSGGGGGGGGGGSSVGAR
jgi:uncharacterized membrane protein YgcG